MLPMNQHPLFHDMNAAYDKGELKEATRIGLALLETYHLLELVSPLICDVLFHDKEKKSFYIQTIQTILSYAKNN